MCRGLEIGVVWLVTSLLRHTRHLEFAMGERREPTPELMLQCAVDLRDCKTGPGLGDARDHMTPRIDDHRIAVGFAAVLMRATLRGREHITEIFDGASAHQQFPVCTTGRSRECGGQAEDLGALRLQYPEELGKTHVVTDGHTEPTQRRR